MDKIIVYSLIGMFILGGAIIMYLKNNGNSQVQDLLKEDFGMDLLPVLTDTLISYWKLDEPNGSVLDVLGIYNGTANGATANQTGIINTAYTFDGNDEITFGDMNNSIDGLSAFSLSAWIYPTENDGTEYHTLASKENVFFLRDNRGDSVKTSQFDVIMFTGGSLRRFKSTATMAINQWQHVAMVYNGTRLLFYYNGSLDPTSAAATGTGASSAYSVKLGRHSSGNDYFNGTIDEVGVWSRALSSSEITSLYNSGNGLAYPFGDTTAPKYQNIAVNNTNPAILDYVLFSTNWTDDVALSSYIFSWNATGVNCDTWANDSVVTFNGVQNWSNVTKQIPATCLLANVPSIGIRIYANDSSNNLNETGIKLLFTGGASTCWTNDGTLLIIPAGCVYNKVTGELETI